jgi:hypothetical protein
VLHDDMASFGSATACDFISSLRSPYIGSSTNVLLLMKLNS